MARMLSQVITVARGSVGGLTFTANQFHAVIIRAKTAPVNPGTLRQTKVRAGFTTASTVWAGLSDGVRNGWIEYADGLDYSGPLGGYKVPGRQVFMSNLGLAHYLADIGLLEPDPPPDAPEVPGFLGVGNVNVQPLTAPGTGFEVTFKDINDEDVMGFAVRSRKFIDSRLRFKGPWLTDSVIGQGAVGGGDGILPFTDLIEDGIYFARFRIISAAEPFRISAEFFLRAYAKVTV